MFKCYVGVTKVFGSDLWNDHKIEYGVDISFGKWRWRNRRWRNCENLTLGRVNVICFLDRIFFFYFKVIYILGINFIIQGSYEYSAFWLLFWGTVIVICHIKKNVLDESKSRIVSPVMFCFISFVRRFLRDAFECIIVMFVILSFKVSKRSLSGWFIAQARVTFVSVKLNYCVFRLWSASGRDYPV